MIQFKKIINTYVSGKIEDIFACDCFLEDLLYFLFSNKKITYDEIIRKLEEVKPNGYLLLKFYDGSIMMCKHSFLYHRLIRNSNFVKEKCCPEFLKIDGEVVTVCLICLMKDVIVNSSNFLTHFRLVDEFRGNGLYLYMQLPIRTYDKNVLQ